MKWFAAGLTAVLSVIAVAFLFWYSLRPCVTPGLADRLDGYQMCRVESYFDPMPCGCGDDQ